MSELAKPVLAGEGGSDYERYLRTDELLRLQKTPDEWIHRDELLFQSVHQTSEIWLKLAWNEIEEAGRLVADDGQSCLYMQDTWLVTAAGGVPLAGLPMRIYDGTEERG